MTIDELEYETYRRFWDEIVAFSSSMTDADLPVVSKIEVDPDMFHIIKRQAPNSVWSPNGKLYISGIEITCKHRNKSSS